MDFSLKKKSVVLSKTKTELFSLRSRNLSNQLIMSPPPSDGFLVNEIRYVKSFIPMQWLGHR